MTVLFYTIFVPLSTVLEQQAAKVSDLKTQNSCFSLTCPMDLPEKPLAWFA